MSNVAGKAYAMNVITPMRPRMTWINNLAFMVARAVPGTLSGLLGLSLIHFARWVIIRRSQWPQLGQPPAKLANDYMLFCSNFNGTWDQYIDAFADGIPTGLDFLWYTSTKYPHSIPIAVFKDYIAANQIQTNYYYNATPGAAQRDIVQALQLRDALRGLAQDHATSDPAAFAAKYSQMLADRQKAFGAQGIAPAASPATERAEAARRRYFDRSQWLPGAPRPDQIAN